MIAAPLLVACSSKHYVVNAPLAATAGAPGGSTTMLQGLDVISAVSAGSLAAAYQPRDRQRCFDEFGTQVLDLDLPARLYARGLSIGGLTASPTWQHLLARMRLCTAPAEPRP